MTARPLPEPDLTAPQDARRFAAAGPMQAEEAIPASAGRALPRSPDRPFGLEARP